MLNIEIISCLSDNYSYLLEDEKLNIIGIIDPSDFDTCDKIIKKKYTIRYKKNDMLSRLKQIIS